MARRPFVVGNWKMHLTLRQAEELAKTIRQRLDSFEGADVGICPPFVALTTVAAVLHGSRIRLGAQNAHWKNEGAFTGEIAPTMLRDVGCRHVILGHSERRQVFGETDTMINAKVKAALACGLEPIICVGETLEERDAERTKDVVRRQLLGALDGVDGTAMERITIAYEPVWAIGTGRNATPQQAQEVHEYLRALVAQHYGTKHAETIRIQYGGSVKPENAKSLLSQPDVDGALVGGASLSADSFVAIVEAALK